MDTPGVVEIGEDRRTSQRAGERTIDLPRLENGFIYQAEEIMDLIRAGKTESKLMPLDDSLAVMRIMDRIRKHWGLRYPME